MTSEVLSQRPYAGIVTRIPVAQYPELHAGLIQNRRESGQCVQTVRGEDRQDRNPEPFADSVQQRGE